MLFCPAEVSYPGADDGPAERGNEAHDKRFAKVVTRIAGPQIATIVDGGENDVHTRTGFRRAIAARESTPPQKIRKAPQINANPKPRILFGRARHAVSAATCHIRCGQPA